MGLVDATTGGDLWVERYDRDLRDIFALQDEVTQKIVAAFAVRLTEGVELNRLQILVPEYDHRDDLKEYSVSACQSRPTPVKECGAESNFNH